MAAWIDSGNYAGWIDWTLDITYKRSNRNDDITFSTTLYSDQIWYIYDKFDTLFYGGEGLLTARPQNGDCQVTFSFSIRGENADEQTIENFIDAQPGEWYNKYVAKHESGVQNDRHYLQFNEIGALNCDLADVKHTPNWGEDCDTCPGGFGLFQLTFFRDPMSNTDRPPSTHELWSWKANAFMGCKCLAYHQSVDIGDHKSANTYMAEERARAFLYGSDFFSVPDETIGGVTFSDGTDRIIEHAVALKRYNGIGIDPKEHGYPDYDVGNRQYCQWDDYEHAWKFHRLAYYMHEGQLQSHNYVERVCSEVP